MIRTSIIPDKNTVSISISVPDNYFGKEMEVIAFTKKEGLEISALPEKKASFTAISIDTRGFKFNRDEANER
jgi:hypothetical protein